MLELGGLLVELVEVPDGHAAWNGARAYPDSSSLQNKHALWWVRIILAPTTPFPRTDRRCTVQ